MIEQFRATGLALSAVLLAVLPAGAQELAFALQAGGTGSDEGKGIAVSEAGTSTITGWFSGTATFGAGGPNATTLTSVGDTDIFVARYDPDGTLAFAVQAGGIGSASGQAIAGDSTVTGRFRGTAVFGAGEPNASTLTATGDDDIFVARYHPDGTLAFAVQAGGDSGNDIGFGVAVDATGASTVTGFFSGTAVFGAGEPNATTLTAAGDSNDVFVAKYNPDGTLAFAVAAGGTGTDIGTGIAVDGVGASIVTGWFSGTATFGAGGPNATTLTSAGGRDIFVARYDPDGTLAFAVRAGGTDNDLGRGIAADGAGAGTVTGYFFGTATFGAGGPNPTTLTATGNSHDIFVAKYNPDGTLAFAVQAGGGGTDAGNGVAVADTGSAVTGWFSGTATFGAGGADPITLTAAGDTDVFVAMHDPDGALASVVQAGGTGYAAGQAIAVAAGATVVTGRFSDTATFGADEPKPIVLTAEGSDDVFVASYGSPGGTPEQQIEALIAQVDALVAAGALKRFQGRRLTVPLNRALRELNRDDLVRACYNLDLFVARARLQVGLDILPEDDGQALIEGGLAVIDELGCRR